MTHERNSPATIDNSTVGGLFTLLEKSQKAFTLYLPNNPIHQQSVRELRAAFAPIWDSLSSLQLSVRETGFEWEDEPVHVDVDRSESMAWVLYKDGVRSVTFTPHVEHEEILRFLKVIQSAKTLQAEAEDDLLTLLWAEDFQHISYQHIEVGDTAGDAPTIEKPGEFDPMGAEGVQEQVAEEIAKPEGIVNLDDFDSTLYFLDSKEIEFLKGEINREYTQDLRTNVLMLLLDTFEIDESVAVREQVAAVLEDLVPYLLGSGDFRTVAYLLREVRELTAKFKDLPPELVARLNQPINKLSEPSALAQLIHSIDDSETPPAKEDLGELFRELKPEALETALELLPPVTNEVTRQALSGAVDQLVKTHPGAVAPALRSQSPSVVLGALGLAAQFRLPGLRAELADLADHEDDSIRLALVETLTALATPTALQQLERMVEDPASEIRIAAVNVLAERKHGVVLPRVEEAVFAKGMRRASLSEKRTFFEAYGVLAGDDGVESLARVLLGKGLRRKADPETRACAAAALGRVGTHDAQTALEKAAKDKEPLVRNAVVKALQEMSRP